MSVSSQEKQRAKARAKEKRQEGGLGETVRVIVHALIIAFVIRTFLFQPFNIPSGSMEATLAIGDYLFVSKYSYGYSHYSLPFSPNIFSGRIFGSVPQRGDVVVFRLPKDDSIDYIKRVIGLPGDQIQMRDGQLYINGEAVKRERADDYFGESSCASGGISRIRRWKETLPNGVSYYTLDCYENGTLDNTQVYTVPEGHLFMMGDNRDNSTDSRVPPAQNGVGYVPFENLVGRAQIIFFSVDTDERGQPQPAWHFWNWPWSVRWSRLFTIVR
jgi:signal peptidase I